MMSKLFLIVIFISPSLICFGQNPLRSDVTTNVSPIKVVEFGVVGERSAVRQINDFWKTLRETDDQGYIINYGSDKEIAKREKWINDSFSLREFDRPRVTLVRGGGKFPRTVMWLIPEGAEYPKP